MKFTVELLRSDVVNGNGRMYPASVVQDMVRQFGELDHPMIGEIGVHDGRESSLVNATHTIDKVWVNHDKKHRLPRKKKKEIKKTFGSNTYNLFTKKGAGVLMGEINVFDKKISKELVAVSCFRPRGIGQYSIDGKIQDDYELLSFDMINSSEDSFKGLMSKSE